MAETLELTALDRHFADFVSGLCAAGSPHLWLTAALASNRAASGNVCLDMSEIAGTKIRLDNTIQSLPPLEVLTTSLRSSGAVGAPGDFAPLILDKGARLYLYRYWQYEQDLARIIIEKAEAPPLPVDRKLLEEGLDRLFPAESPEATDLQRKAAMTAVEKRFSVISGGPGAGKTSTVVKILALLLEQASGNRSRIALAAPTGKAAARLRESICRAKETLQCSAQITTMIPEQTLTIHRLLGTRSGSTRFRHCAKNPLPFDLVVIDEASMVSLPLMAKLAAALKPDTRLILLGDRDQLASVEAGAVLGDICGSGTEAGSSALLRDCIVTLTRNYRFQEAGGIGAVAAAINRGDGAHARALLAESGAWHERPEPKLFRRQAADMLLAGYAPYCAAASAEEALSLFSAFRVLCALRQGPLGVEAMNLLIEGLLTEKRLIRPQGRWYAGRPVLINANDYALNLFNGDIGITWPDPLAGGALKVCFPDGSGGTRKISPLRLPHHETAFAMTIHKSQGSEFSKVLMLLPDHDTALLTRELLYTGLTRARERAEIIGDSGLFITAAARRIERASGLREALWPG